MLPLRSTHEHSLGTTTSMAAALSRLWQAPVSQRSSQLSQLVVPNFMQVKLTIQGEAYSGVMLQQTVVVDFQVCLLFPAV